VRRATISTAITTALVMFLFATAALAAKPDCNRKDCPPPDTTTTTMDPGDPALWTCRARIDNGATGWELGAWDETLGAYTGNLPLCVDMEAGHRRVTAWVVTWDGATVKGTETIKGLLLRFEEEVHATTYAEAEVTTVSGTWQATLTPATPPRSLVFVAMPHSGDKWDWSSITVTPMLP
jgi:hypothetical protein